MRIEQKLEQMRLPLPESAKPVASYIPAVRSGNLVFCSGQLPTRAGSLLHRGQVNVDVSEDDAYECARVAALNCLAAIKTVVADLDSISRIVRVTGYVSSADGFTNQPAIVNGASDFLVELFAEAGHHARAAIGVSQLPLNAPVEIDMIVEVHD